MCYILGLKFIVYLQGNDACFLSDINLNVQKVCSIKVLNGKILWVAFLMMA